ncbi:MAG: hypothetical protein BWY63_03873 [Chloroflexi bacterium ADurb.Bin360]|nr:MAG: hypothetical protein BWY63_03873 [Chloroflexi bacterium ADurb.Bin360]
MAVLKAGPGARTHPQLRFYAKFTAAHLRRLLEKGNSQTHLARGAGSNPGIGDTAHHLRRHPRTIVAQFKREPIGAEILINVKEYQTGAGFGAVLENIQQMLRKLPKNRHSYFRKDLETSAGLTRPRISSSIITTGACEQAPTQRQISRVKRLSSVVSPILTPKTC